MSFDFIYLEKNFFQQAKGLEEYYLQQFNNPLEAHEKRFVWDYWHVPGQYTLVRTPAYHFFPSEIYQKLEESLKEWGRKHLGCSDISPPWLSYYIEGCEQQLHADNPHGPWAFVYSLTDWENKKFRGGETVLLASQVMDYWRDFSSDKGFERDTLLEEIPPVFNQLAVFDPRIPHGVNTVHGVKDPRSARIVIHGWFLEPEPILTGGLSGQNIDEALNSGLSPVFEKFDHLGPMDGYVGTQIQIDKSGAVTQVKIFVNTLKSLAGQLEDPSKVESILHELLMGLKLPTSGENSQLMLPFIFK